MRRNKFFDQLWKILWDHLGPLWEEAHLRSIPPQRGSTLSTRSALWVRRKSLELSERYPSWRGLFAAGSYLWNCRRFLSLVRTQGVILALRKLPRVRLFIEVLQEYHFLLLIPLWPLLALFTLVFYETPFYVPGAWAFHGLLSALTLASIARVARKRQQRSARVAYINLSFYYLHGALAIVFLSEFVFSSMVTLEGQYVGPTVGHCILSLTVFFLLRKDYGALEDEENYYFHLLLWGLNWVSLVTCVGLLFAQSQLEQLLPSVAVQGRLLAELAAVASLNSLCLGSIAQSPSPKKNSLKLSEWEYARFLRRSWALVEKKHFLYNRVFLLFFELWGYFTWGLILLRMVGKFLDFPPSSFLLLLIVNSLLFLFVSCLIVAYTLSLCYAIAWRGEALGFQRERVWSAQLAKAPGTAPWSPGEPSRFARRAWALVERRRGAWFARVAQGPWRSPWVLGPVLANLIIVTFLYTWPTLSMLLVLGVILVVSVAFLVQRCYLRVLLSQREIALVRCREYQRHLAWRRRTQAAARARALRLYRERWPGLSEEELEPLVSLHVEAEQALWETRRGRNSP